MEPRRTRRLESFVSQLAPATGTTPALNRLLSVRVVVVRQLLPRLDVARRADPDDIADDLAVAVRSARVVDEAGDIAADVGIADPSAVHGEAPDLAPRQVPRLALEA